ncbi:RHS repeat-associated core domain-containing protein [Spirillospora sp. CA-253888]
MISAGVLSAPAAQASTPRFDPQDRERVVKGHRLKAKPRKPDDAVKNPAASPRAAWPKPGVVEVEVPGAAALRAGKPAPAVRAGDLPISITAPTARPGVHGTAAAQQAAGKVRVQVLDRKAAARAGVNGPVFALGRSDAATPGRVGVQLDYSKFAQAYGGSYGSRLRLVRLPACAVTTPEKAECRTTTPVAAVNRSESGTLSGTVDAAPLTSGPAPSQEGATPQRQATAPAGVGTILAATSGTSGDKGDYGATSLSAAGTWQVGTQTGDFNWSYPMRVPPVPGGLTPELTLSYSSASIDGRTSNANNQSSWAGDGFQLWPGHIERKYKSCKDDGVPKDDEYKEYPADQCWGYDNATLSLGGQSGELIPAGDDRWRLRKDDGTRIEKLTSSTIDNGDKDGEYWKVTVPSGTTYYFGLNTLAAGKPKTNSTWTAPVFGDDKGEPCHGATFKESWCQQAYRWNLDKVVDVNGNAVTYHYRQEKNHYGRNLRAKKETEYVRGGYLERAEYGLKDDNLFPAEGAPARVDFTASERCLRTTAADCAEANIKDHPGYWEDTPWDLNCNEDQECKDEHGSVSPSFWSRKRLSNITTKILKSDGSGYRAVDSWELKHAWSNGDTDRQLLLESIVARGLGGDKPVALPPVTFNYAQMENRVDKLGDDDGPFVKARLATVYNELGGQLDVNYTKQDCSPDDLPTEAGNSRRCFPTYRMKSTGTEENPTLDWFHKYAVAQVVQTDLTGGAPDMITDYDYSLGKPAWHFDDDQGLQPDKYKTWSQFHGFSRVRTITRGGTGGVSGQTDTWYFQGMDGDRADKEGKETKPAVPVPAGAGDVATYADHESLQGMEALTVQYDKAGGTPVTKTAVEPWHRQTASHTRKWGTVTANFVAPRIQTVSSLVEGGKWRQTKVVNKEFDEVTGKPVLVENLGDTDPAVTNDDRCTTTTLLHNTTRWLVGLPSEIKTVSTRCGEKADYTKQLVAAVRNHYDGKAFGEAPVQGLVTQSDKVSPAKTTADAIAFVPEGRTKYDSYGRPWSTTAVDNTTTPAVERTTTTQYSDTKGLNTGLKTISPPAVAGDAATVHETSKTVDPAWGTTLTETDAAGLTTQIAHDALGRTTKIWASDRNTAQTPTSEYEYLLDPSTITAVATKQLTKDGGQEISYRLLDGWGRTRQTQETGPDGGRVISDTFYNARGKAAKVYGAYYAAGAPTAALFGVDKPGDVETQSITEYDGLGRTTAERLRVGNSDQGDKWQTTYAYTGNTVTVTPPQGGTPVTTVTDALNRMVERRAHWTEAVGFSRTTYSYNDNGQLEKVAAPDGSTYTHTYDIRGRKVSQTTPDAGTVRYTYDDIDQLVQTEEPRTNGAGKPFTLRYSYDNLGRQQALVDATSGSTPTKLAEWTYDTVRKGQRASSIRYAGPLTFTFRNVYFDARNRPTRTNIKVAGLPDSEKSLVPSNGYTYSTTYNLDGSLKTTGMPAAGSLASEVVSYAYDDLGRPTTAESDRSSYVVRTDYSKTDKMLGFQMASSPTGKKTDVTYTYEYGTQRLKNVLARHDGTAGYDRSATYTYNDAGAITQIADTTRDGVDNQCFRYDYLQRLTDAWTQATANGAKPECAADPDKPAQVTLGGPAPYRYHYDYDVSGNRTKEAKYTSTGQAEFEREYKYAPATGADGKKVKGHQLAGVTRAGQTAPEETYAYDAMGNTINRNTPAGTQKLTWDVEGKLAKVSDSKAGDTTFDYDTAGERFMRHDRTGTTLYLPGQEVRLDKGAAKPKAIRYYQFAGQQVASRSDDGKLTFLVSDHHNTAELSIDAAGGTYAQRRFTPFGVVRGTKGTWPAQQERGFIGGIFDASTGLTHLGARDYDPNTGRFISRDPIVDEGDSQQLNGYTYSNNNPINSMDPTGLLPWGSWWDSATNWDFSWNGLQNFTGGWFDGALQSWIDPFLNLYNMPANMNNLNASIINGATGKQTVPTVEKKTINVHVSGADKNTKEYKAGKIGGQVVGIPIPALGAAKSASGVAAGVSVVKSIKNFEKGTQKFQKAHAAARAEAGAPFVRGANNSRKSTQAIVSMGRMKAGQSVDDALNDLEAALPQFALNGKNANQPASRTYAGGVNKRTGETAMASSGGRNNCGSTYCAEGNVLRALGGDPSEVMFTRAWQAVNQNKGKPNATEQDWVAELKEVCWKCQVDYPWKLDNFRPDAVGESRKNGPGFWEQTGQQ